MNELTDNVEEAAEEFVAAAKKSALKNPIVRVIIVASIVAAAGGIKIATDQVDDFNGWYCRGEISEALRPYEKAVACCEGVIKSGGYDCSSCLEELEPDNNADNDND